MLGQLRPGALICLLIVAMLFTFQNCGQGISLTADNDLRFSSSDISSTINPNISPDVQDRLKALDKTKTLGISRADCLSSSSSQACIFWKNPRAQFLAFGGTGVDEPSETGVADVNQISAQQNFGINLSQFTSTDALSNSTFDIFWKDGTSERRLALNSGQWKGALKTGYLTSTSPDQRYAVEQVQTFFYLNAYKKVMGTQFGGSYSDNKGIKVNVISAEAEYNAFFDSTTNRLEIGFKSDSLNHFYPLSLNGEVILHEISHANLHHGKPSLSEASDDSLAIVDCPSKGAGDFFVIDASEVVTTAEQNAFEASYLSQCGAALDYSKLSLLGYCKTSDGCLGAINEGQADFFAYTMFSSSPYMGELALPTNTARFWKKRSDVTKANISSKMGFDYRDDLKNVVRRVTAEIHDGGEVYSEILFDIYADTKVDAQTFAKTVNGHLKQLIGTSTFVDSKNILLAIDANLYGSKNQSSIKYYFEKRGF